MPQVPATRTLLVINDRLVGGDASATMPFISIRPGLLGGWAVYDRRFVLGLLPKHTCTKMEDLQQYVNRWAAGLED